MYRKHPQVGGGGYVVHELLFLRSARSKIEQTDGASLQYSVIVPLPTAQLQPLGPTLALLIGIRGWAGVQDWAKLQKDLVNLFVTEKISSALRLSLTF